MDDISLWSQLKAGNHKALKQIYELNIRNLDNYAQKFTTDVALIEDTIHDIFVQIWNKRESLGNTDSIIKYLCVSLRRELIRRIGKAQDIVGFEGSENTNFTLSVEDMIISDETTDQNKKMLAQAMQNLSGRQKEAIYLRYFEEMEYEEICEIMSINYQSVRNLISKGIIELRQYMALLVYFITFLLLMS